MEIFECKCGTLPEDLIENFDDFHYFIVGKSISDVESELETTNFQIRIGYRINKKWYCEEYPQYWREMTIEEKRKFIKYLNKIYM